MGAQLRFIMVFYGLVLMSTTHGQSVPRSANELTIGFGAMHTRLIDEAFTHNRLKFYGTAFTPLVTYQRQFNHHLFRIAAVGNKTNLKSKDREFDAELIHFDVSLSYAYRVVDHVLLTRESQLAVGVQVAAINELLLELEIIEDATVTFLYTGNVYLLHTTHLSDRSDLRMELYLPLAGFIKRESYDGGANKQLESEYIENRFDLFFDDASFHFMNPLTLPRIHLKYLYRAGGRTDLMCRYQFHYLVNREIAPIRLYGNGLQVGLNFNF